MSAFPLSILGFWPTYPGHPCTLALLVLRKYPDIGTASTPGRRALEDGDIPGAGGAVHQALWLIGCVRKGTLTPDAAIRWGIDGWREGRLGGDHRAHYEEGVAEEASVVPLLREALTKVAPSAAAASG